MTSGDGGPYAVRAVLRVIDILELLENAPLGVGLGRVTAVTGLPKSSAYRYLSTLESRGFVERDGGGNYHLVRAFMPARTQHLDRLAARARPLLETLRERFGETLNLGVIDGLRVSYLEIVESPHAMRLQARKGDRDPIHSTALGKAIAASLSDDRIHQILRVEGMPALTSHTITDPDRYLAEIREVRERGYAIDNGENEEGGRCVAVPLSDAPVPTAVSLSAPAVRFPMDRVDEVVDALRDFDRACRDGRSGVRSVVSGEESRSR